MYSNDIVNLQDLKESNIAQVLRSICTTKNCSRVSLAHSTGLKQATITKIVNRLIDWGIVREDEAISSTAVGRKPVRLIINAEKYLVVSVRLERNNILLAVMDIAGGLHYQSDSPIKEHSEPSAVLEKLKSMIRIAIDNMAVPPMAIGLAVPGPLNRTKSRITLMSTSPGWEQIDIKGELAEAFHLPILINHNANCGALAEQWYGDFHAYSNILYVLCDRGVGSGLILNGSIYYGAQGFAGEIGHMSINKYGPICECGNRGCLELYASTFALENEYKRNVAEMLPSDYPDELYLPAETILTRVRNRSDDAALKSYDRIVSNLGFGIVGIVNVINPDLIIFADRIIDGGSRFLEIMDRTLKTYLLPDVYNNLTIATSTLQHDSSLIGAGVFAFEHVLQTPSAYFVNKNE